MQSYRNHNKISNMNGGNTIIAYNKISRNGGNTNSNSYIATKSIQSCNNSIHKVKPKYEQSSHLYSNSSQDARVPTQPIP